MFIKGTDVWRHCGHAFIFYSVAIFCVVFAGQDGWAQGLPETSAAEEAPKTLDVNAVREEAKRLLSLDKYDEAQNVVLTFASGKTQKDWDKIRALDSVFNVLLKNEDSKLLDNFIQKALLVDEGAAHLLQAWYIGTSRIRSEAAQSMYYLSQHAPTLLHEITIKKIWKAINQLRKDEHEDAVYELLQALKAIPYNGGKEIGTPQHLYLELARLHLEKGRVEEASKIALNDLIEPSVLLKLWHDRSYEPLWHDLEAAGKFDSENLIRAKIGLADYAIYRAKFVGMDGFLSAVAEKVGAYRSAGDLDRAEEEAREILDLMPTNKMEYEGYAWLTNELAYVYQSQGEVEKVVDLMTPLTTADVSKHRDLINQEINFASMLVEMGRFEQAIQVADRFLGLNTQFATEYGKYWVLTSKTCALEKLGRTKEAKAIFSKMRVNEKANIRAVTEAGLCLDELDYVASLYIQRLEDQVQRGNALLALSSLDTGGSHNFKMVLHEKVQEIAKRPDVKAAISKVGRVGNWALSRDYWDSY